MPNTTTLPKFYFVHTGESCRVLCIKRGYEGFYAPLSWEFESWQEAKATADGMNYINTKEFGLTANPDLEEAMINGCLFGWDSLMLPSVDEKADRMTEARKTLGLQRLMHAVGIGWGEII